MNPNLVGNLVLCATCLVTMNILAINYVIILKHLGQLLHLLLTIEIWKKSMIQSIWILMQASSMN